MSEKCYPQKGKRYVTASGEITGPLREGIMPGQFAFSCDHLHTSWHDNGVHAGFNNSKNLVRELEESKAPAPEADSTSETPRRTAMSDDPTQDAHSLGIALRLAHAQNRDLRKQLATATEALDEADDELRFAEDTVKGREGDAITKARGILQQALAAIKPNQGEHP